MAVDENGNIWTFVKKTVPLAQTDNPTLRIIYKVELSPNAKYLVSSKIDSIEVSRLDNLGNMIHTSFTPEEARVLSRTILAALNADAAPMPKLPDPEKKSKR